MTTICKKMIKIPETGMLPIKGGIYGPIETPHLVDVEDIKLMLFYGTKVLEVIEGQNDVELTLANYNTNNTMVKKAIIQEQPQPKQQPKVEEPKQQPVVTEQPKVEEPKQQPKAEQPNLEKVIKQVKGK